MKKNYLIIGGVIIIILGIIGGFWFWRGRQVKEPTPTKEPEGTLIETTLAERPLVTLTPTDDGHWLTIDVSRIRDADSLEYELLYNTESGATQGSINTVSLKGETSYSKKILLGSESSGKFKYDEGVTQGTLTIRLRGGPGTRKFVTEFHLQQGDDELTSIDEKFSLTGSLLPTDFYVTMMTIGLPGEFENEVIVGPYGVFTSGTATVKNGEVSLKLPDEVTSAKLSAWTGTKWQETEAEVKNKTILAEVDSLATFIVSIE